MEANIAQRANLSRRLWLPAILGLGLGLLWVFWPTLSELSRRWFMQSQYSHGYIVPLFALALLWMRRDKLKEVKWQPAWSGLFLLAAGLALHFAGIYVFFDWFSQVALLPCLAGLFILAGGWRALAWSWPAILFLFFMVPLPFSLEIALAHPLQRIATIASTFVLQTLGFVAFAQGNVIHLGDFQIGVVEACNGLSMLVVFFALAAAIVFVFPLSLVEKFIVLASAIPIALVSNITRIVVTALLYQLSSAEIAQFFFHDVAGWMMMVFALGLLWVELRILSWVLISVPVVEDSGKSLFTGSPFSPANLGADVRPADKTPAKVSK